MLTGKLRESSSKKEIKLLRRDGFILANIYAKGMENVHCAFKKNEFIKFVRNKPSLKFKVQLESNTYDVIIQEYQKDPVNGEILHIDLRVLKQGEVSNFMVPVRTIGTPIGLRNKGVLVFSKRRLKVACAPENLPDQFTLDVTALNVGDNFLVRDVEVPSGVEVCVDGRVAVVGVIKAK
jgi:large subunit ribosomal protein L25